MFFFSVFILPLKPNRFGSVGVFPVSGFVNRNRTKPKILTKKIIGLIGFFFGTVFFVVFFLSLLGFSVFLLTPSFFCFENQESQCLPQPSSERSFAASHKLRVPQILSFSCPLHQAVSCRMGIGISLSLG